MPAEDTQGPVRTKPFPNWPQRDAKAAQGLLGVLDSGLWGSNVGHLARTFESRFAEYQQAQFCTTVCNGTLALDTALRAAEIGVGDEVIVPTYTFIATAAAVCHVGATPVFADVEPRSLLIDPERVRDLVTARTKAVIPVHLAGCPADMDALQAVSQEAGLFVIEDAAQAHGASWNGKRVGTLGDVGAFSFQSSKNITAGEGGAVVTNDQSVADRLYSLANVGRVRSGGWYQHESVGYNLRLTEFQAAVLHAGLDRHPAEQALRTHNAQRLQTRLGALGGLKFQQIDPRVTEHGQHILIIRIPRLSSSQARADFVAALISEGIPAMAGYEPLHRNAALLARAAKNAQHGGHDYRPAECPVADARSAQLIWLPQNLLLTDEEGIDDVVRAFSKVLDRAASSRLCTHH